MRLKELRLSKNLTQNEFGKLFNCKQNLIANYESGKNKPDYLTLIKFADFFNVSVDYLINHKTKNTFDTSSISNTKKELINTILNLEDRTCERLEAVIYGYLNSYKETRLKMQNNFFNKKEN